MSLPESRLVSNGCQGRNLPLQFYVFSGVPVIEELLRDTRYSVRRLIRDWRFTAAAVLILGFGIGVNTASFSLVNASLFRGSPIAEPDRLVDIYQNGVNPGAIDANSYPAYLDMAEQNDVFASTAAVLVPRGVMYQDQNALRPAVAEHTTATYPSVLGLRPYLGRWFNATEDTRGAEVAGVIGYRAWTRKFNREPSVVGRTLRIDGVPVTIVGVGPAGHDGTLNLGVVTDFWLPISSLLPMGVAPRLLERRPAEAPFLVKARLQDGVSVAQAQAAMHILGARLAAEYPKEDPGKGISIFPASEVRVHPQLDSVMRWSALVLLAVVGLVLGIACSNLATLLLVRGGARAKEVSVRLALGATRGQLVRHLLTESLLLSFAGGILGCILAWWTIRVLGTIDLPIGLNLSLDYRVLMFATGLSLLTGAAFGIVPALASTRVDLVPTLRDQGQMTSADHQWLSLKNAFVVFQVAVSVVLLGGTSIFVQMLSASRAQRPGFAVEGLAMLQTDTRYAGYSAAAARNLFEDVRRRITAIPGVQSAVLARGLPMEVSGVPVIVDGIPTEAASRASAIWAGPGFFEALRIPILYGRAIDERDRESTQRVAVINEVMARKYFGAVNAVGRRFRLEQDVSTWIEVVGVVRDTGTADLDVVNPPQALVYRSFAQWNLQPDTLLARTSLDAAGLVGSLQREMRAVDASLPVVYANTMAQYLEASLLAPKAVATTLGGLGALGMCLAAIGLYAVVAFRVSRQSREIGIRLALGARSSQVVWTVTKEVAVLLGVGTAVGLFLSVLAILALRGFSAPAPGISLYRPTPDPVALLSIAAFMATVGLLAASMPAWRASTIDPLKTLRRD